jgi:hypothetical protein
MRMAQNILFVSVYLSSMIVWPFRRYIILLVLLVLQFLKVIVKEIVSD